MSKFLEWVDERFPLTKTWQEHLAQYYAPKNFNFWYYFGSLALLVLVIQIVTGIFLTMHYKPDATGLRIRRVHHAGRALGLAHALPALHRRLDVLRGGVPAHVPRPALRLIPGAARTGLADRHDHLRGADGRSLHGLPAALGQHVLLGRPGHHFPVWRNSGMSASPWRNGSGGTSWCRTPH
jgi:hypothetical protein